MRRNLTRLSIFALLAIVVRWLFFTSTTQEKLPEIREHNVFERVARPDKLFNVQKHTFLQARLGRDERPDLFSDVVKNGVNDHWERFQLPYMTARETSHMDAQSVLSAIDQLLTLNGWVTGLCPTLVRPFGQNKNEDTYDDLAREDHLYYISIVIHSADHFLVDQLAVIVQLAKRLGSMNLFVSMLDYDSTDSTATLTDLCEAVLTLLGIPFRIRKVAGMTEDPVAAYYPLEEAQMRNLALEPLKELFKKRNTVFHRVIWLKGFTCPNDILETLKVSMANEAAMVCGMDWAEHNGFYIFSDRWRTRDIEGDQFRQSKSSSKPDAVPPRDATGSQRYSQHLPFQVFCCESGTHIVDPAQTYYKGITYRAGTDFFNASAPGANNVSPPERRPNAACLDSSQAWFCRDIWVRSAHEAMKEMDAANEVIHRKRSNEGPKADLSPKKAKRAVEDKRKGRLGPPIDADANAGSDYDAMPDSDEPLANFSSAPSPFSIPNSVFHPARILVNPRCVTTYAGVKHTQLALDLFGSPEDNEEEQLATNRSTKYILDDWDGAPDSFVCQEQTSTGGRQATKTQRRLGFSVHDELQRIQ